MAGATQRLRQRRGEGHDSGTASQPLQPVTGPAPEVGDGKHDDLLGPRDVSDGEGEACKEKPPDLQLRGEAWPERPGRRPLDDGVQGVLQLLGEIGAQARALPFVPVARRFEVALGTGMKANLHELPATPAAREARTHRSPVLRLHRPGADFAGALLQLRDPRLGSIGVGAIVETEDELVGDASALPGGKREHGGEDVGGLEGHRQEYSPKGFDAQGGSAGG